MEELLLTCFVYSFCPAIAGFIVWSHPNWKGTILSAITLWIFLFMGMVLLIGRYSTGGPGGAMAALWLVGGWCPSAVFAIIIGSVSLAWRESAGDS